MLPEEDEGLKSDIFNEYFDFVVIAIPPGIRGGKPLNKKGFQALAEAISGMNTKHCIFISSTGIYDHSSLPIDESSPVNKESALHHIESCFKEISRTKKLTVIRMGGLIGPGRYPGRFLAGKEGVSDPEASVNLIHQTDAVGIIMKSLENMCEGILNGVMPKTCSRKEFYTKACEWMKLEHPSFDNSSASKEKRVISKRLKDELKYSFAFEDPLSATKSILSNSTIQ